MAGVGVGITSTDGVGVGDTSGVWGNACSPGSGAETGEAVGVDAGNASGSCGNAGRPVPGVETGEGTGACARSGHAGIAASNPAPMKRVLTETKALMDILVQ